MSQIDIFFNVDLNQAAKPKQKNVKVYSTGLAEIDPFVYEEDGVQTFSEGKDLAEK